MNSLADLFTILLCIVVSIKYLCFVWLTGLCSSGIVVTEVLDSQVLLLVYYLQVVMIVRRV
jgi:hypothetical protein